MNRARSLTVALTGNYGSGKSYVLSIFKEMGAYTIDCDELVRKILRIDPVKAELKDLLGEEVLTPDGELDRKAIGEIIFKDPFLRLKVEDIIHPFVFKEIENIISSLEQDKVVIVEIPVLFERGYQNRFERIITVYADETTITNRMAVKGLPREELLKRWNSQFPYQMKIKSSDFVIDNSEGKDLKGQVYNIFTQLQKELQKGE